MPKIEWKEETRRYALGFFPLVGAVIGGLLILWRIVCSKLCIGQFLFASAAAFLPIVVTGGIHLDGFCDVNDARASYGDKRKKLEIMSDPHIGSFAVIKLCIYLIVLSRSLSGLTAVTFKSAKSGGTLQSFVRPAHKRITVAMELIFIIISICTSLFFQPFQGAAAVIAAFLVLVWHRHTAYRDFGGITGDLCGWFLQMSEIFMLAAVVFTERTAALW